MISNVIFQANSENTLAEKLKEAFIKKPKKAYFFCGNLKETGFKLIEDELIDTDIKSYFVIGIDKKNTTKVMLEDILRYTKDVYFYSNNKEVEFSSNIWIFEYTKKIVIYSINGSVSDNSLSTDISLYIENIYDLEDKDESKLVKKQIKDLLKKFEEIGFEKLNKTKIEELVEQKEIFTTRQYVHSVMSIAELLGKKEDKREESQESKKDAEDDFSLGTKMPKIDLNDSFDIDFDIDIPEEKFVPSTKEEKENKESKEENISIDIEKENEKIDIPEEYDDENNDNDIIDKNNELYDESLEDFDFDENDTIDINSMLFSKSDIKLDLNKNDENDEEENKETKNDNEIVQVKKLNLNNITNYIFELPSKPSKGQDVCNLKIPNYINNMIPDFFEINENGKNEKIDGVDYKLRDIELEIVDVKNDKKYTDRRAKLTHKIGQTYISFSSDCIKEIPYSEKDIVRIIKLSPNVYHMEIIANDLQEYNLWSKLCNQKFKSSERKYGMM